MPDLKELLAQQEKLRAQAEALAREIEQTKLRERADAIARVQALMAEYGLTMADLGARPARAAKATKAPRGGGKVAPKFRDAATGQTWSGRGLQPNWLKAALAAGRSLDEFRV